MPASRAAWTTLAVASASRRPPKLLQPTPTTVTSKDPIRRVSMDFLPLLPGCPMEVREQVSHLGAISPVLRLQAEHISAPASARGPPGKPDPDVPVPLHGPQQVFDRLLADLRGGSG